MRENGTMGYAPTVEPFEVDDRPISSFRVGYDDFNSDQSTVTITGAARRDLADANLVEAT